MNDKPTKGSTSRVHGNVSETSRKSLMQALEVGESLIFVCEPGQAVTALQRSISSAFRDQSFANLGLEQQRGLLVFEGELSVPVSRVTRIHPPKKS
ncbi:hypothetical protein D3C85_870560 [compost metagenome]